MYKLKQIPEDFCVEEIADYDTLESGDFMVLKMQKINLTTLEAIEKTGRILGINYGDIGYAGLKDKNAITTQFITAKESFLRKHFPNIGSVKDNFKSDGIKLELTGFRNERIYPGCLKENKFSIIIRNITHEPKKVTKMINYFGEQRFSEMNHIIGKMIIKGDYKGAAELITKSSRDEKVKNAFESDPNNPIKAIKMLMPNILRIYLNAYQGELWNKAVFNYVKKIENIKSDNQNKATITKLPLPGFSIDGSDEEIAIIEEAMKEDGVSMHDFILRKLPGFGTEGGERQLFINLKEMQIGKLEDDELNPGMKKIKVEFALPKGCYATEYIKQIVND